MSRVERAAAVFWEDDRGNDYTLIISRGVRGIEIEQTIQHDEPDLYSGNRTIKTITLPANPETLTRVARVLLNIAKFEKGAVNCE